MKIISTCEISQGDSPSMAVSGSQVVNIFTCQIFALIRGPRATSRHPHSASSDALSCRLRIGACPGALSSLPAFQPGECLVLSPACGGPLLGPAVPASPLSSSETFSLLCGWWSFSSDRLCSLLSAQFLACIFG